MCKRCIHIVGVCLCEQIITHKYTHTHTDNVEQSVGQIALKAINRSGSNVGRQFVVQVLAFKVLRCRL